MILLATIAHGRPRLISEQIRLLRDNLEDEYELLVFDTSSSDQIRNVCFQTSTQYLRLSVQMHHEGLNEAAAILQDMHSSYFGFLDHDIFPVSRTRLEPLIEEAGFYGVGQRHPATGHLYLWPGFCFFSRKWLAGRPLDFSGLRDGDRRNDGDTGSSLWPLFAEEEWEKMYRADHSYKVIRRPDQYGLQSWGYEVIGDWIHFSNGSDWMRVPNPKEREKLLFDLLK